MGVAITDVLSKHDISFADLSGKIIAIDAHIFLYQFLSTIRQRDGTPLMDSKGNVTSHLSGLFFRSTKLMSYGLRLIYVFDGKPPELKLKELEKRRQTKADAQADYNAAKDAEDIKAMEKYAKRTSRLTRNMIAEAKTLIHALGIPIVEAPSEGEAQAAQLVKEGTAYAVGGQDADAFLFGAPRVVRNLSLVGRKKQRSKLSYETFKPELIHLDETLNTLGIDQQKLIALGMLVGTDFNIGGIKNIGAKKALNLVKKHDNLETLFTEVEWDAHCSTPWQNVYALFSDLPVKTNVSIDWRPPDNNALHHLLVTTHDFNNERVTNSLKKWQDEQQKAAQKGLGDFL